MSTDSQSTFFGGAKLITPDPIFEVTKRYLADKDPKKVNLGQGAYRDENGAPWILPSVRAATESIAGCGHEYLPIEGLNTFREEAAKLVFGGTTAWKEDRAETGIKKVFITDPTWSNHDLLFASMGYEVNKIPYFKNGEFDHEGFVKVLKTADRQSAIVLHACAHNPTGCDPSREQWKEISAIIKETGAFPIFDSAYLGFNSGSFDEDAWIIRYMVEDLGLEAAVCMSFAKSMGLYGERVGLVACVTKSPETARALFSLLQNAQRATVSNPPVYGARIAAAVLGNPEIAKQWAQDLITMSSRILTMRKKLYSELLRLETPGDWSHIVKQNGMFGYTGISSTQIVELEVNHHVYMANTSRISLAGLNEGNVEYFAKALDQVVRTIQ
ncbi:hypothetical protein G7Z17_g6745 [Cylindrodendrum hubeiense]|uniref:Aspartate aminotransferase n=1 Tax=Cylindrodendrum hubeiense TaxID=595255 RepID=A0A9P5L7Z4_9HYPO|nr:hypothetical protein G7Z17_g6745 [Cylindrodendrum hubeiense]